MIGGRLRDRVQVATVGDEVVIHHQFLELGLPRKWVEDNLEMQALLSRQITANELCTRSREVRGVVDFLAAQDCFFSSRSKTSYSLREVKEIFEPIALTWYAEYYRHPLWNKLRGGELNRNGFVAWVLHNYHVSRTAGKSGSRCAVRFPRKELRSFFRTDVLEEYWHCDVFYFIDQPGLSISEREVKNYVPLPASIAFEQYTVLVAESDFLAHLLISYFQESSIRFYSDCQDFYREVETAYALPDFFKTWTAHMRLDFDHGHAENFIRLFDSDERVSHADLVGSLATAWFAFSFLYAALDQIVTEAGRNSEVILRNPVFKGLLDPAVSSLSPASARVRARDLRQLAMELASLCPALASVADDDKAIRSGIVDALFYSMSHASEHDAIIVIGKLIESFPDSQEFRPTPSLSPSTVAITSMLRTSATDVRSLLFLLYIATELGCEWSVSDKDALAQLESLLEQAELDGPCVDRFATLGLQWIELISWHAVDLDRCPIAFEI